VPEWFENCLKQHKKRTGVTAEVCAEAQATDLPFTHRKDFYFLSGT
jgi:hypothetical protein